MGDFSHLATDAVVAIPPPPPRFTLDEWYLNNRMRNRLVEDQQQLADRILEESNRIREETDERTRTNKQEVDHRIKEKLLDIDFRKNEINKQRREVCLEVDALVTYKERIMDAMAALKEQALKICKKCLILREGRLGIDLAHDDVERELKKEIEIIEGSQGLLRRLLEQAHEQTRRLKSTLYFMDRDLEDKNNAYALDLHNSGLKETSINLSLYHGHAPLDPANITAEEWEWYTAKNIAAAAKEINSAVPLRSYIDTLLKQCIEDLTNQFNVVNDAFRRRINETKEVKTKLELQHNETVRQANEMVRNITRLEKSIAEKEGFMALAHTRLGNRAQRPGVELCRDLVETKLVDEVLQLRQNVGTLQQMLSESQASLRYLLKAQIQIEEDINVKTNSLKIDEVDCMTLRNGMTYFAY